jgi:hypothetical protein
MNIAGMMAKYFATSFAIENVVRAPRHQQLLADLDDLDQLGRVRTEFPAAPVPPAVLMLKRLSDLARMTPTARCRRRTAPSESP